jgi:hypothetical protein
MRALGMAPVLPAFAGHVPPVLKELRPTANITKLQPWAGFNDTYSGDFLLDAGDALYLQIQASFFAHLDANVPQRRTFTMQTGHTVYRHAAPCRRW